METLLAVFPDLATEITQELSRMGKGDLAAQLSQAVITDVTFDNSADAGYIYVKAGRQLNIVEEQTIGVRHGETVCLETKNWINLDTDNFGRLTGIELLSPPAAWKAELRKRRAV